METKVIKCSCFAPEHSIQVSFDWECQTVYFHYFIENQKWYKRIWIGIKYIFGFKSQYGHFGEIVVGYNNTPVFEEIIKCLKPIPNENI